MYHPLEPPFIMGRAKEDIISDSSILDPGLLWHKGEGSLRRLRLSASDLFIYLFIMPLARHTS